MKIKNHLLVAEDGDTFLFRESPNQSALISPSYLIMHYTAGTTLEEVVEWFLDPEAQSSAHLVIGRAGEIVQMVPFNKKAWHAGVSSWGLLRDLNQHSIGIELVNAGKLKRRGDGAWISWANVVIPDHEVGAQSHGLDGESLGWHKYTFEQIMSAIKIASLLHEAYRFLGVLGHQDVSPGRKLDPGPLFPLQSFGSIVLGRSRSA